MTAISGGSTASFTYDGFGRRMKKTIGGTTTQFLYDGLNPVQELNGKHNAAVIANLLTGLGIDEYFTRTDASTGVTSTLLADALGSTIGLVTSNNGPIATNYTYQPFGGTSAGGSANGNSCQFTGRENDGTGLHFYRARYYSPTFQRFIAQDPLDFRGGGPNLYGYVVNDPINAIDARGLKITPACPGTCPPTPPGKSRLAANSGLHPNFPPVISRDRRLLTCPAKVYQVEVENSACVIRLRPVWPAFSALNRLK